MDRAIASGLTGHRCYAARQSQIYSQLVAHTEDSFRKMINNHPSYRSNSWIVYGTTSCKYHYQYHWLAGLMMSMCGNGITCIQTAVGRDDHIVTFCVPLHFNSICTLCSNQCTAQQLVATSWLLLVEYSTHAMPVVDGVLYNSYIAIQTFHQCRL